jgi:hypothetical protein
MDKNLLNFFISLVVDFSGFVTGMGVLCGISLILKGTLSVKMWLSTLLPGFIGIEIGKWLWGNIFTIFGKKKISAPVVVHKPGYRDFVILAAFFQTFPVIFILVKFIIFFSIIYGSFAFSIKIGMVLETVFKKYGYSDSTFEYVMLFVLVINFLIAFLFAMSVIVMYYILLADYDMFYKVIFESYKPSDTQMSIIVNNMAKLYLYL